MHVKGLARFSERDTVLIIGAGVIGLSCVIGAKQRGTRVLISDVFDSRLEFAKIFGADWLINAKASDTVREVQRVTSGRGVDVAVDAVGVELTIRQAVSSAKQAGRVVLVGNLVENALVSILEVTSREIQVNGSYGRTDGDFRQALKLLGEGQWNVRPLITQRFPLDQVSEAFEFSAKQMDKSVKVLLLP
jgi:threonine dehydrogenase-like Zn-dependent dehydrogenase